MFTRRVSAVVIASTLLTMPMVARAQGVGTPALSIGEVSGGYLYESHDDTGFNGWQSSVAVNLNRWFGIAGEISGVYHGSEAISTPIGPVLNEKRQRYAVIGGPRFFWQIGRVVPYGEILAGGHLERVGSHSDAWNWAIQPGGGVTVLLTNHFGVRAAGELQRVIFSEGDVSPEDQPRFSAGLVFGWGTR